MPMSRIRRPSSGNRGIAPSRFLKSNHACGAQDREVVGVVSQLAEYFGIVLAEQWSCTANREGRFSHPQRGSWVLKPAGHRMVNFDKVVARGKLGIAHQVGRRVQWRARDSRRLKDIHDFILA